MSDIVERLRGYAKDQGRRHNIEDTCEAAADEIERLRAENKRLANSRNKWGQRYNQTLEKLRHAIMSDSEYCKAIDDENERLRAALRFYADEGLDGYDVDVTNYGVSTETGNIIRDAGKIARAALANTEPQG